MTSRKALNLLTPVVRPFCNLKTKRLMERRGGFGEYRHLNRVFKEIHEKMKPVKWAPK